MPSETVTNENQIPEIPEVVLEIDTLGDFPDVDLEDNEIINEILWEKSIKKNLRGFYP